MVPGDGPASPGARKVYAPDDLAPGGAARPGGPVALVALPFELPTGALVEVLQDVADGHAVIAAVLDDDTTRALTGSPPLAPLDDRLRLAVSLRAVARVTVCPHDGLPALIERIAPDELLVDPEQPAPPGVSLPIRRLSRKVLAAERELRQAMRHGGPESGDAVR